jgi:hypothetical protein
VSSLFIDPFTDNTQNDPAPKASGTEKPDGTLTPHKLDSSPLPPLSPPSASRFKSPTLSLDSEDENYNGGKKRSNTHGMSPTKSERRK